MSTDISNVQAQPGAATVRETVIVPGPIRDGPDRRLAIGELVKDSHASDMTHKRGDQIVERESNDTALNLKLNACKSTTFGKTRCSITR